MVTSPSGEPITFILQKMDMHLGDLMIYHYIPRLIHLSVFTRVLFVVDGA